MTLFTFLFFSFDLCFRKYQKLKHGPCLIEQDKLGNGSPLQVSMAFTTESHDVERELGITVQSLLVDQSIILKERLQLITKKKNSAFSKKADWNAQRRQELPTHTINPDASSSLNRNLQSGNIVVIKWSIKDTLESGIKNIRSHKLSI